MVRAIRLSPIASIADFVGEGELVAFGVGPEGTAYLVAALNPVDYRDLSGSGASFPKTIAEPQQRYRVVAFSGAELISETPIDNERFNIHHVQPLGDHLLLVCCRSHYRGPSDFERNGRVYDRSGKLVREILLGDGIQSVQTTGEGVIWTSYFDEGIFGSFGWQAPVGSSGLVAWDSAGNKLYEFETRPGLDICDCYALNVESERDVWCYYYTEFPLVRLRSRRIDSVWRTPLAGSDAFAVLGEHAVFRGGYKDRETYQVFELGRGDKVNLLGKIALQDEKGSKLMSDWAVGRANAIWSVRNNLVYKLDVLTALAAT
ncbi:MAG: hypothetical protein ACJ8F7_04980 [Gemmataceae bacterium]